MCEYCRSGYPLEKVDVFGKTRVGKDMEILPCANPTGLSSAVLWQAQGDMPGIVMFSKCGEAMGYFIVNYCPMCGRSLHSAQEQNTRKHNVVAMLFEAYNNNLFSQEKEGDNVGDKD